MKAKEYLEKYKDTIHPSGDIKELSPLILDFLKETAGIIESRKCRSGSAVKAVIKELNTKYVKTVTMLNNYFGVDYIRTEGYLLMFKKVNPQIVNPITGKHIVDDLLPPSQ